MQKCVLWHYGCPEYKSQLEDVSLSLVQLNQVSYHSAIFVISQILENKRCSPNKLFVIVFEKLNAQTATLQTN